MRYIASIALGILLLTAPVRAQDAAAIERGQKVYVTQKCSTCHSIAGKGNKKGPLDEVGSKLTAEEIRLWIVDAPEMTKKAKATRKPVMKSYEKLPKEDVDALVAYMQSLKKS
jgi:mono/diheme cytochrome c family protein